MLDDLLHHLVTEMAMDGEEGCSVARIDGFVESYYARRRTHYPSEPIQLIDASYKNFVWKNLRQLDQVRLGVLEPKINTNEDGGESAVAEAEEETNLIGPSQPSEDSSGTNTFELPVIASNDIVHQMAQRQTRPSKSASRRSLIEKRQPAKQSEGSTISLSIGQIRALETGKVQKNLLAPESKAVSKRVKAASKPSAPPVVPVWQELSVELANLSRDELMEKFGVDEDGVSRLRIAVDPTTCWKAVIGTDTRSPKITAYVYQVLCIVAQGREDGATVIELGRKLKHDQKSLFHFVKVLTDLQLVVKFRAYQHKAWTNRVVHRRYLATSEWYKNSVKKDEDPSASTSQSQGFHTIDDTGSGMDPTNTAHQDNDQLVSRTMDDILDSIDHGDRIMPPMSPITKEHLAVNEALVRSRLFTVLKRSPNHAMVHADIIKAIGIASPTKDERRRLNRHIDVYIKRGLVEKVAIVNAHGHTPCIRLTALGEASMTTVALDAPQAVQTNPDHEIEEDLGVLPITRSIGQVIFDMISSSGQEGIIYKDICNKLNDIEIRTAEQILTRMERDQAPAHLSDLQVASVLESSGREKRVRWFSVESLKKRCQAAAIPLPTCHSEIQLDKVGGFIDFHPLTVEQAFYQSARQLYGIAAPEPKGNWGNRLKRSSASATSTCIGRPRKYPRGATAAEKKSLREKEAAGIDVAEERNVLEKKYEHLNGGQSKSSRSGKTSVSRKKARSANSAQDGEYAASSSTKRTAENSQSAAGSQRAKRVRIESHTTTPTPVAAPSTPEIPTHEVGDQLPESSTPLQNAADLVVDLVGPQSPPALLPDEQPNKAEVVLDPPPNSLGSSSLTRGARQNLTTLHREYQLLEAIKYAGGIVEKSHELSKAVRDLVDQADQSHASSLMDNRTLNVTLYGLEARGEIKSTTVLLTDALGASFRRKVLYLSNISLDGPEMVSWLEDMKLRFKAPDKVTESHTKGDTEFGPTASQSTDRFQAFSQPHLPSELGLDDERLHAAFLNQWRCVAQLYGFVLGKVARARILHISLLKAFQNLASSRTSNMIITSGHRVFASSFLFQEIPVSIFVKLVPVLSKNHEFEKFRATPGAMETPMGKAPLAIRRSMQIGQQFSRMKVYQIVETLCHLKLLIPLEKTSAVTQYHRVTANGETVYYSPCIMGVGVGQFCLVDEGAVYKFSERPPALPPMISKWPLKDDRDGEQFWAELKRASIPDPDSPAIERHVDPSDSDKVFGGPARIHQMLPDRAKWQDDIQLTPTQRQYLVRFDAQQTDPPIDLETDDEKLAHIAHVLVTVPEALRKALRASRKDAALARELQARKAQAAKRGTKKGPKADDAERLKAAQEAAARMISEKAKNAIKQKENDWNSIINRFKTQSGISEIDEEVLQDLHVLFTTPNRGINAAQLESELAGWLKRKEAAKQSASVNVVPDEELSGIAANIDTSKRGQLPMLPSAKAKCIKMLSAQIKSRQLAAKKIPPPRVLPDKPRRFCAVAARAIRPQEHVDRGARPPPQAVPIPGRRMRIEWDDTLDDFLRDMIAILRARAYATSAHVLPWPIVLEVFRGAKTHVLKNRCIKLERDRKEKIYLDLLTQAWTQLYFEKRGKVEELADPMPTVPAKLNGGLALDYLRANIDKRYLRAQANSTDDDQEDISQNLLPETYFRLGSQFRVKRVLSERPSERWDEIYFSLNSVIREDKIKKEAFSAPFKIATTGKVRSLPHEVLRACEAIKLLTSTPIKTYSEPVATRLLSRYPENVLAAATNHLCMTGILTIGAKLHYKKRLPGRSYRYTDKYVCIPDTRALRDPTERSLEQIRKKIAASSTGELTWSLIANDTDTAALIHAVSRGKVSLELDWRLNRAKRWQLGNFYRTRKLSDDSIENVVTVKLKNSGVATNSPPNELPLSSAQLDLIKATIHQAGSQGIVPKELMRLLADQIPTEAIGHGVAALNKMSPAEVDWTCDQSSLVLFSTQYLDRWAEKVVPTNRAGLCDMVKRTKPIEHDSESVYLVPRLWFDLSGNLVENLWYLSLNRVENLIQSLPGVPYTEVRRRTRLHLNLLELDDVLEELIRVRKVIGHPRDIDGEHCGDMLGVRARWVRGFSPSHHFWTLN